MSSLVTLREAMRETIDNALGGVKAVSVHGGKFGVEQLRAYGAAAPCAVLASPGMSQLAYEGGQVVARVAWVLVIMAKDTANKRRDEVALELVEAALACVTPVQRWGKHASHAPDDDSIKADNLYGSDLDKMGIAMWAITWTQRQDINVADVSQIADLLSVHIETNLASREHDGIADPATETPGSTDIVTLAGAGS